MFHDKIQKTVYKNNNKTRTLGYAVVLLVLLYRAIQQSWFARVNALCNLSAKKSREVAVHFRANFWVGVASRCV